MSKSKRVLSILISTMMWLNVVSYTQTANAKPTPTHKSFVYVEMINMSGLPREAHVRNVVVPLPVAQRVALQVFQGER